MKKYIFLTLGAITFVIGTLGIFLPVLPTTGFYLLTGFFWMRSSDKMYKKLTSFKGYQKYVTPFLQKKMTQKERRHMFIMMGIVFLISVIFVPYWWIKIILVLTYVSLVIGLSIYLNKKPINQLKSPTTEQPNPEIRVNSTVIKSFVTDDEI